MNQDEERLVRHGRRLLDDSVECMDATTRARLEGARRRALAQTRRPAWPYRRVVVAAAAASILGAAVLFSLPTEIREPDRVLADLDILTTPEQIELYQELEFYEWLEADAASG